MIHGILYKDETGKLDYLDCLLDAIAAHTRRLGYKPTHCQVKGNVGDAGQVCGLMVGPGPVQSNQYLVGIWYDGTAKDLELAIARAKGLTVKMAFRDVLPPEPEVAPEFSELAKSITEKNKELYTRFHENPVNHEKPETVAGSAQLSLF